MEVKEVVFVCVCPFDTDTQLWYFAICVYHGSLTVLMVSV